MNFIDNLLDTARKNNSLVCVGLDPNPELMPDKLGIFEFNRAIIDATRDLVCAYKLNFAFYEVFGAEGFDILKRTADYIPDNIPAIADAKRGDIGNTAKAYAQAIFSNLNFDAATVNPYLGFDSVEPFIQYHDRVVFILCRTSNPGARDFQDLVVNGRTVYQIIAGMAAERWNLNGNVLLVVGATYPVELKEIRSIVGDMPLLVPGIGAQGGDVHAAVTNGKDSRGTGMIINSSRGIIYAGHGHSYAEAARHAAKTQRDEINKYR